jgi:hypothetical protein
MTMIDKDSKDIEFPNSASFEKPVKKSHCLYDITFVVLHDKLVRELNINDDTYFTQEKIKDGIILRIERVFQNKTYLDPNHQT